MAKTTEVVERVVERPSYRPRPMSHKKVGRPTTLNAERAVRFVSDAKMATVYLGNADFIVFKDHLYITDDLKEIKLLRESSLFNNGIWENEFPANLIQKYAEDKKYLSRVNEESQLVSIM